MPLPSLDSETKPESPLGLSSSSPAYIASRKKTIKWQRIRQHGSFAFMDVKIGTFAEMRKMHFYNRLLEQSVLSLSEGRLDWEEIAKGL